MKRIGPPVKMRDLIAVSFCSCSAAHQYVCGSDGNLANFAAEKRAYGIMYRYVGLTSLYMAVMMSIIIYSWHYVPHYVPNSSECYTEMWVSSLWRALDILRITTLF